MGLEKALNLGSSTGRGSMPHPNAELVDGRKNEAPADGLRDGLRDDWSKIGFVEDVSMFVMNGEDDKILDNRDGPVVWIDDFDPEDTVESGRATKDGGDVSLGDGDKDVSIADIKDDDAAGDKPDNNGGMGEEEERFGTKIAAVAALCKDEFTVTAAAAALCTEELNGIILESDMGSLRW
jgi:hypothetical protein